MNRANIFYKIKQQAYGLKVTLEYWESADASVCLFSRTKYVPVIQ